MIVAIFRRRLRRGKASIDEVSEQEHQRHGPIAEVIESIELRAFYALGSEHDFTAEPHEIDPASADSLLAALRNP